MNNPVETMSVREMIVSNICEYLSQSQILSNVGRCRYHILYAYTDECSGPAARRCFNFKAARLLSGSMLTVSSCRFFLLRPTFLKRWNLETTDYG